MTVAIEKILPIFPETARVTEMNHLSIGDCDCPELAARFGTPLYVFDEETLRNRCREFLHEFSSRYTNTSVLYAAKAYINRSLARVFMEEGLGIDVVSAGELAIVRSIGFPMDRVYFHGNNKGADEIEFALNAGIGLVVVDNFYELLLLNDIARKLRKTQTALLRISPDVDPHTHAKTTTGVLDSKFGFALATGDAEKAVAQALKSSHVKLVGIHIHLGSPIFELEPYELGIQVALKFAAEMKQKHGLETEEFSPGGGFAIQYIQETPPPPVARYAEVIASSVVTQCKSLGLRQPKLVVEPGRAIVGRAGVALYTVGSTKDIPGVRKYVSVDGGMADNIRPAIYGSRYEALVANRVKGDAFEKVTIAGKYCESGDILIKDITLPRLRPGDIVAVPASGAYCLAMASNYNVALKPPIVLVKNGEARLIRRRETYDDLLRTDVLEG